MRREDLERIRILNDAIADGLERIAYIKSKAYPGAIVYDDSGASKPMPTNKMEQVFARLDKQERKVNALIDEKYALKQQAIRVIQAAIAPDDMRERHILYLRYLARDPKTGRALGWQTIIYQAHKYHNISERKVYQLHHDAVRKVESYKI